MSTSRTFPPASAPGTWPMYRAMVGVGLACGLLIVTVYQLTLPRIERNQAEALERAIFHVLPDARTSVTWAYTEAGGFVAGADAPPGAPEIHVGLDANGALVGFAIPAQGMGYQDAIHLIYGYSPDRDAIVGMEVLESRETPGLGDRIQSDPDFRANFKDLDVSLTPDGSAIAHPVEAVKHGDKDEPWQIDGITGATISSRAVASILAKSTEYWLPRLHSDLDLFRKGR